MNTCRSLISSGPRRLALTAALVLGFACAESFAQAPSVGRALSRDEIEPLVAFIKKHVVVLEKPIFIYNFFDAKDADPVWRSQLSAADPIGYRSVQVSAEGYWRGQGEDSGSNTMGNGLYAALDPVATRSYGGEEDFVLRRMELPKGARIVNLLNSTSKIPDDVVKIYESLGCVWRNGAIPGGSVRRLFEAKPGSSQLCFDTLRNIVDGELRVDALVYRCSAAVFRDCSPSVRPSTEPPLSTTLFTRFERRSAFVILSNRWMRPESVRVFNRHTTDALDERLKIQSMYYKTVADMASDPAMGRSLAHSSGWTELPKFEYPTEISASNRPFTSGPFKGLLWDDLEGKQTDPHIGRYIQQTQLGCTDEVPWKAAYP